MSHNPSRLGPGQVNRQRPTPTSSVVRKYTKSAATVPKGEHKHSAHGTIVELLNAKNFVARYELMHPRNSTGLIVNQSADRLIVVLRGAVFVSIQEEGKPLEQVKILAGNHVAIPAGVAHGLATSGTEPVEMHIVEDVGYDENIEIIETPTFNRDNNFQEVAVAEATPVRRYTPEQQREAALQHAGFNRPAAQQPDSVQAPPININSSNVLGVSPKPFIPRGD